MAIPIIGIVVRRIVVVVKHIHHLELETFVVIVVELDLLNFLLLTSY